MKRSLKLAGLAVVSVSMSLATGCGGPADEAMGSDDGTSTLTTGLTSDGSGMDATSDTGGSGDTSGSGDTTGTGTTGTTGTTDDTGTSGESGTTGTTGGDECSTYRTQYPAGPYGTQVNNVLAPIDGLVLGDGTITGLEDVYADTSKVALLLVNAFDT